MIKANRPSTDADIDFDPDILSSVVQLTQRVGELLVKMQSRVRSGARSKGDGSPVSRADRAAHETLVRGLPGIAPYLVVSEESEPDEIARRLDCERIWIVDPLDGTRDYLKGSVEYTVNVALVERGVPVLGVVDAPGFGVTYCAQRGRGAFRIVGGESERIHAAREAAENGAIVVSKSDERFNWAGIPSFAHARVRAVSSSVKLGFVAEGSAVAYPRLTASSEWDIAAGHAVLAEAGGRIVGIDGADLVYNKPSPLNPPFLATGSPEIALAFGSILLSARTS